MPEAAVAELAARPIPRFSLFGRLLLLVVVPLLLLVVGAVMNAREEFEFAEQAALETASAVAQQAAARLDEHFNDVDQLLTALGEVARNALERGEDADPQLKRMLDALPQHINGLSVLSLDGRMIATTTASAQARADVRVSDRAYFKDALATRSLAVGEPMLSRTNNQWVCIAARAVLNDKGEPLGAVSMSTRIDRFQAVLVPRGLPRGTLMTVLNDKGVGVSSTLDPITAIGRDYTASATVRRALQERSFAARLAASDGRERFTAYAAGTKLPWIVEAGLPLEETLAPARERLRHRLLYVAAAFLVGLVAAYWLAQWIAQPLLGLTRDVVKLGDGKLDAPATGAGYGEVQRLSAAINDMAAAIDARQRELKASEERFRSLVFLSSDWYWTQDTEYRFTSHSQGRFGDIALSAADFRGKTRWDMPGAEPVGTTWAEHRALLDARRPWRDLTVRYRDSNGETQYIASSGEPVFDAHGGFAGYRGVARLVTERFRLEAALRESEERLRATLEYSPNVAVQWYDRDGRVRFWNQASTAVFGWTAEDATGRTLGEIGLYTPAQSGEFIAALRAVDQEGPRAHPQETVIRRKDGTQGVIVSTLFPISSPSGERLYACMDVDVTQRVQLEKELRERIDLFRVTLETIPVCIALIRTLDNVALLTNRATNDTFAVDPQAARWNVVEHWERKEDMRDMLRRIQRDGYARDMEVPVHIPGRERMWALLSAHPARYMGEDVLVVTLHDVTQRKALEVQRDAAEKALRVSEAKFRALTALSSDWYWEQDAEFRFTHVGSTDPRWALPMLGKTRWDLDGEPLGMTWDEHKRQLDQGETFRNLVFRYTVADGASMWLSVNGEAIFDEGGRFCGYRGTATDVTRRYRLEEEIKERMELFRTTLDTSPVTTALVRVRDNVVLLANRAAYQTFRVNPDTPAWNVLDHRDRPEDLRDFASRIKRDGFVRDMEVPVRIPERGRAWMQVSAQPARLQGEAVMVVTMHDITDSKALQSQREALLKDLHGANERLRLLSRQVLDAQEAERRQIAHELHDEIGQSLSALKLFAGHLRGVAPPSAHAALDEWIGIVDRTVAQVRDLSRLLRPVQLDHMGLAPALRALLDTQARAAGWVTTFDVAGARHRADTRAETVCYRVVQEALNNAARHADAASVSISLEQSENEMKVHIEDDGRGFDVAAAQARVREGASMGLLGMQERVQLAGGSFHIESAPASGTRIDAVIPVMETTP